MFSKAPIRRFNDEIGCGPPPTKYDPRAPGSSSTAFSLPKSERFVEPRAGPAPGPAQYQHVTTTIMAATPSTTRCRRTKTCVSVGRGCANTPRMTRCDSADCTVQSDDTDSQLLLQSEIAELRAQNVKLQSALDMLKNQQQGSCSTSSAETSDNTQSALVTLQQLLDNIQRLDARVSAAEHLLAESSMMKRLDHDDHDDDEGQTNTDVQHQQQHEQNVRVKELELLVQVARESEVVAHDTCCSLQQRLSSEQLVAGQQRAQLQTAADTADQLQTRLAAASAQLEAVQAERDDAEQETLLLIGRNDDLLAEVAQLRQKVARADMAAADTATSLAEASASVDQLTQQLQASRCNELTVAARLDACEADRAEAELRAAAVECHLASAGQEGDELRRQLAAVGEQLAEAGESRAAVERLLEEAQRRRDELHKQAEQVEHERDGLSAELRRVSEAYEQAQCRLATMTGEHDQLVERVAAASERRDVVEKGLASVMQEKERLAELLAEYDGRCETQRSDVWYSQLQQRLTTDDMHRACERLAERESCVRRLQSMVTEKDTRLTALTERDELMQRDMAAVLDQLRQAHADTLTERALAEQAAAREQQRLEQLAQRDSTVKQLKSEVCSWQQQVMSVSRELYDKSRALNELETRQCENADEMSVLHGKLETLQAQLDGERTAFGRLSADKSSLANKLSELELEKSHVTEELLEMTACADEQIELRCRLEQEVRELRQRLTSSSETLSHKEHMLTQMSQDLTELSHSRDQLRAHCHQLTDDVSQAEQRLQAVQLDNEQLASSVATAGQQVDSLTNQLNQQLTLNNSLSTRLQEATCETVSLTQQLSDEKSCVESLTQHLSQEQSQVELLNGQLCEERARFHSTSQQLYEHKTQVAALHDEIAQSNIQVNDLRKQLCEVNVVQDSLAVKLTAQQDRADSINVRLTEEQARSRSLEDKLSGEQERSDLLKDQLKQQQVRTEILQDQLSEEQAITDSLNEKLTQKQLEADAINGKLNEEYARTDSLNQLLSQEQGKIDSLNEKVYAKSCHIDSLNEKLIQEQIRADSLNERLSQAESTSEQLSVCEHKLTESLELADQLRARLASVEQRSQCCSQQLAQSQQSNEKLSNEISSVRQERDIAVTNAQQREGEHDKDLASLYDKFAAMRARLRELVDCEQQLAQTRGLVERLQQAFSESEKQLAEHSRRADELNEQMTVHTRHTDEWRVKYEKLAALVAPFQVELDQYEAERECLLTQRDVSRAEMQRLSTQYSQLLGHQNKKQKLHHIMKLKEENLSLKMRNSDLDKDMRKMRAKLRSLEEQLMANGGANDGPASTLLNSTLSSRAKNNKLKSGSYDMNMSQAGVSMMSSLAELSDVKENLALLAVTPLREKQQQQHRRSPMTSTLNNNNNAQTGVTSAASASISLQSPRRLDFA